MEPHFRVLVTMRSWRTSLASAGYANLLDAHPRLAEVVDVSDAYPLDEAHMCRVIAERGPFHACLVGDDALSAAVVDALADRISADPYPHVGYPQMRGRPQRHRQGGGKAARGAGQHHPPPRAVSQSGCGG